MNADSPCLRTQVPDARGIEHQLRICRNIFGLMNTCRGTEEDDVVFGDFRPGEYVRPRDQNAPVFAAQETDPAGTLLSPYRLPYSCMTVPKCRPSKRSSREESLRDAGTSSQSLMDGSRTTPKPGIFTNSGVATQTTSRRLEDSSGSHNSRSAGVHVYEVRKRSGRRRVPPSRAAS